ncbi:hypothetical protein BLOT_007379 [Blomia tropicalis]|nr:hypothetical protein BLOT_007379 [Blomia tropicalis]
MFGAEIRARFHHVEGKKTRQTFSREKVSRKGISDLDLGGRFRRGPNNSQGLGGQFRSDPNNSQSLFFQTPCIQLLYSSLQIIEGCIEVICKKNCTLVEAFCSIEITLNELANQNNQISNLLKDVYAV